MSVAGSTNQLVEKDSDRISISSGQKDDVVTVKVPFTKTVGFKVLIGAVCVVVVAIIVIPTTLCLTGHCGTSGPACILNCAEDPVHWTYHDDGSDPVCWGECFTTCNAKSQSPIDLVETAAMPAYDNITRMGYENIQTISLINNGHTVECGLSQTAEITGLGLPGTYRAQQFHFHWGVDSNQGSEHTIGGTAYPMELHLVHYSTNYSDFSEASDKPQGLAVLGIMFEISSLDNTVLIPLVDAIKTIPFEANTGTLNMTLNDVLGGEETLLYDDYYMYSGSLTTPPCHESVVWTVFTHPIPISEAQMDVFRNLYHGEDSSSGHLHDNYRPTRPVNGRPVYLT